MSVALVSLFACEIDLIATVATERGVELETLSLGRAADFIYAKYVAGGKGHDPGYQKVQYTLKIKSKNATRAQLEDFAKLCETSSPVGDTFSRSVPISMKLIVECEL